MISVLLLADQQMLTISRDIQNQLKRKGAEISERTVRRRLNEANGKFSPPMSRPLLKEGHQMNRLKWVEAQPPVPCTLSIKMTCLHGSVSSVSSVVY